MKITQNKIYRIINLIFIIFVTFTAVYSQTAVFSPDTLYMGKIPLSSNAVRKFKIYNIDANNLEISSIQSSGGDFKILDNPGATTLGIAQEIVLDVEFTPSSVGPIEAEITIVSNTDNGLTVIPINGEGLQNTLPFFERIFGPAEGGNLRSIKETPDGGYILVGSTENPDEEVNDIYIVKTDQFGATEWTKTIEDEDRSQNASEIILSDDDHYIVLGGTTDDNSDKSDFMLLKLDLSGEIVWEKTYDGSRDDNSRSLVKTSDGGYLLVGDSDSFNDGSNKDIYIVKVDQNGEEQWYKTYGGDGGESARQVINTNDGGFAIIGDTDSKGAGDQNIWLLKLDSNADHQWDQTYGSTIRAGGYDVAEFPNGEGYAIAGYSIENEDNARDMFLVTTDKQGNEKWKRAYDGVRYQDRATNVLIVDDGIIIAGNMEVIIAPPNQYSDIFLIKTDFDGNEIWREQFGGEKGESASEMILNSDNHIVITGATTSYGNNSRVYFLNLSDRGNYLGLSDKIDAILPDDFIIISNYPNPFNSSTNISYQIKNDSRVVLNIYDILGHKIQKLLDINQNAGHHSFKWDANGLAAGTYFLEVKTENQSLIKKMMYLK